MPQHAIRVHGVVWDECHGGPLANIARDANKIDDEIRKARKRLETMIRNAREVLEALDVVVQDEAAERGSPIGGDGGDYERAVEGLKRVELSMTDGVAAKRVQDHGDSEE